MPVRCFFLQKKLRFGLLQDLATGFPVPECLCRHFVLMLDLTKYHQSCPAVTIVGDVLALELEEPVDSPGITIGTWFSLLHWMFLTFWGLKWFSATGPLI